MCGITGFFSFNRSSSISADELILMTSVLSHRGPNDEGCVLIDGRKSVSFKSSGRALDGLRAPIGLGHRRLSIIDLHDRSAQPMAHESLPVWMVYNGEVYNYVELRGELTGLGHTFLTMSDTEVVLKAWIEWGPGCFPKFNGMWALAVYDGRTGELVLSRDRLGKKPLYHFRSSDSVIFGSEPKAVFACPGVSKQVNPRKIVNYAARHYRYVDIDDESFFDGLMQVPPASYSVFGKDGSETTRTYWDLSFARRIDERPEAEIVAEFSELLGSAVSLRLRSDVSVGSMLSGGMDSTTVTSLAARGNADFTAFSAVTGEGYYDESEYIREVVGKSGVKSQFVYPQAGDLFPTLSEMLRFHDEPVCTVTWYSLYLITREIAKAGIPVILTGHGGDELLAGYWDHYHHFFGDIRAAGGDDTLERDAWLANHGRDPKEYDRERAYVEALRTDKRLEVGKWSQYLDCLSPAIRDADREPVLESPVSDGLKRRLFLELTREAVPPALRAEDRNSMAFSIENRVPFLDYRLIEFCAALPSRFKIRNGLGKWLLREVTKGLLPEKVRTRKDKTGHNAPADKWWREDNRLELLDLMSRRNYINEEVYDIAKVKDRFTRHLAGENHYMFFWQYINLHLWHELHWP